MRNLATGAMRHMTSIIVPELLPEKEIESMRPREKQRYIESVILKVLERSPRGATISEIESRTHFARNTVTKHLNRLVATRQATRAVRSGVSIYYRNGNVVAAIDYRDRTNPDHFYTLMKLRNEDGDFVYVQEKEVDELRSIKVRGGVMIAASVAPGFVKRLRDFVFEVEK